MQSRSGLKPFFHLRRELGVGDQPVLYAQDAGHVCYELLGDLLELDAADVAAKLDHTSIDLDVQRVEVATAEARVVVQARQCLFGYLFIRTVLWQRLQIGTANGQLDTVRSDRASPGEWRHDVARREKSEQCAMYDN